MVAAHLNGDTLGASISKGPVALVTVAGETDYSTAIHEGLHLRIDSSAAMESVNRSLKRGAASKERAALVRQAAQWVEDVCLFHPSVGLPTWRWHEWVAYICEACLVVGGLKGYLLKVIVAGVARSKGYAVPPVAYLAIQGSMVEGRAMLENAADFEAWGLKVARAITRGRLPSPRSRAALILACPRAAVTGGGGGGGGKVKVEALEVGGPAYNDGDGGGEITEGKQQEKPAGVCDTSYRGTGVQIAQGWTEVEANLDLSRVEDLRRWVGGRELMVYPTPAIVRGEREGVERYRWYGGLRGPSLAIYGKGCVMAPPDEVRRLLGEAAKVKVRGRDSSARWSRSGSSLSVERLIEEGPARCFDRDGSDRGLERLPSCAVLLDLSGSMRQGIIGTRDRKSSMACAAGMMIERGAGRGRCLWFGHTTTLTGRGERSVVYELDSPASLQRMSEWMMANNSDGHAIEAVVDRCVVKGLERVVMVCDGQPACNGWRESRAKGPVDFTRWAVRHAKACGVEVRCIMLGVSATQAPAGYEDVEYRAVPHGGVSDLVAALEWAVGP
jgi:hypothetical protein